MREVVEIFREANSAIKALALGANVQIHQYYFEFFFWRQRSPVSRFVAMSDKRIIGIIVVGINECPLTATNWVLIYRELLTNFMPA